MNSPTHSLLALALLSKKGQTKRNWAVFIGSLVPDLAIYLWAPYQRFVNGVSGAEMWRELYFQPPMQNLIAFFNSIPIYLALALIGWLSRAKTFGKVLLFFALAALIHMATDMPVHSEDAYRHFWPLTDWRFYSPLSYWDRSHHAGWVSVFEAIIALVSIIILWKRFPKLWVKLLLSILALFYIAFQVMMIVAHLQISG
jgi:hypothetical protein